MSDEPSDKALIKQQADLVLSLQRIVEQHQLLIFTLCAYLREQPAFDAARFGAIHREFRDDPGTTQRQLESSVRSLRDFLASVEGTRH